MSDRIDELVALAAFLNDNGCDKCEIVTELATIARENAAEISELQSATKNEATRIVTEYVPWQSNDKHPRRVVLAYIKRLEAMCEWLAMVCAEYDMELNDRRTLPQPTWDDSAYFLARAREAVQREGND